MLKKSIKNNKTSPLEIYYKIGWLSSKLQFSLTKAYIKPKHVHQVQI